MNNKRRDAIGELISELESIKAKIEDLQSEEQECFDNMTDSLQQTERGQMSEEAANNLQSAVDCMEDVLSYLEEAKQ